MKRIEELSISRPPWLYSGGIDDGGYEIANLEKLSICLSQRTDARNRFADSRLIAAAPEMYECLREAVIEVCHNFTCCGSCEDGYACHGDRECFVKRWRAALAKASGEEVKA